MKKNIIAVILIALILVYPAVNFMRGRNDAVPTFVPSQIGNAEVLDVFAQVDAADVQSAIRDAEKDREDEPVTEPSTEATIEATTKPTTEPSTQNTTKPSTEPSTDNTSKPTKPVEEPSTEATTKPEKEPDKKPDKNTSDSKKVKETLKKLENGETTYRKVFSDVYIVGDSLMNGLEAYGILNSNHLITQVSASLYHLDENVNKIIKMNPPVLILHYGINMISTDEYQRNKFIKTYTGLINELKEGLPDTRIIISGIFPVDRSVAKAERFAGIPAYNKALKKMCSELDVEFLDSSSVLKEHKECYGSDGIHLSKAFYEKYWLKHIIREMEITL